MVVVVTQIYKPMRQPGGISVIYSAIEKLRSKHDEHMKVYGEDNDKRMSGLYETARKFSFDNMQPVNRGASVMLDMKMDADILKIEDLLLTWILTLLKLVYTICM